MERLGRFAYRRRTLLVASAAVLATVAAVGGRTVFANVKPYGFQDPHSQSARAYDLLERHTHERPLPSVELLIRSAPGDLPSAAARAAAKLRQVPGVIRVVEPAGDPRLLAGDRRTALILGYISSRVGDIADTGAVVRKRFSGDRAVTTGGTAVTLDELTTTTQDDLRRIELFALPVLLLLSLVVFRGLVAAALPVLVGGLSILTTLALLNALTVVMDIDAFAINIVTGLGLGLAIDYSLFLVTAYREQLDRGVTTSAAVVETTARIGPMVAFSGTTVALSLVALCIFPQRFLYSIGIGGALVALSSAVVCLLFLPAILALLGHRVNALAPRAVQGPPSDRPWSALARFVLDHPVSVAIVSVALMVLFSLPALGIQLTQEDARTLPADTSAHQVEIAVGRHFSMDPANRIVAAVPARTRALEARRSFARDSAVAGTEGPQRVGPGLYRVDAQLRVNPYSEKALNVVKSERSASWADGSLIGGQPAELTDSRHSIAAHAPVAVAFILLTTGLLLFVMSRSVLLPIIALFMNTLTVTVAFGVLVFVFQDGRLEGALSYTSRGGLDTSMPVLLFAVVFGLSTDYGVFLLQRIAEARRSGVSDSIAIARGVERSGWQITAAAVLFAVAMGAFAFSDIVSVKEVAVGTAVAVLVDAMVIRPLVFPALLRLAGPAAWWCPAYLRRQLQTIRPL